MHDRFPLTNMGIEVARKGENAFLLQCWVVADSGTSTKEANPLDAA
jgi:hypothetical protein